MRIFEKKNFVNNCFPSTLMCVFFCRYVVGTSIVSTCGFDHCYVRMDGQTVYTYMKLLFLSIACFYFCHPHIIDNFSMKKKLHFR